MRLELSGLAMFTVALAACTCADPQTSPDAQGDSGLDAGSNDASNATNDVPGDTPESTPDAARLPARSLWVNPSPPMCARRGDPPRWRVMSEPGAVGTVRWVRSLAEPDFGNWRRLGISVGGVGFDALRIGPVVTGDGVVVWTFQNVHNTQHDIGFGPSGAFAMTGHGPFGGSDRERLTNTPRMWLPTENAIFRGHGLDGSLVEAPEPPSFFERNLSTVGLPPRFGPRGEVAYVDGSPAAEMPAWSALTGDFVTFGSGLATSGVGAGCAEGNRWFTQLPLNAFSTAWVRPDGDVIVGTFGELWVLDGDNGEVLRSSVIIDDLYYNQPSAYFPGCGVLVQIETATRWRWIDDDTMEPGPLLSLPGGVSTGLKSWSGTPDCGLVASAASGTLLRLNADGSIRYNTTVPAGTAITSASPPVALADGGTLLMTDPPGWIQLNAAGEVTSTVSLDTARVGLRSAAPAVLAPDGTMYFMTLSGSEYRFGAASTGAIPGPYLWPNSGLNWARTNSILPD